MRKFLKSKTLKILVCCTLIFTFICFSVSAETGRIFTVAISQPPSGDDFGYVEILARDNVGYYFVEVYLFSIAHNMGSDDVLDNSLRLDITANDHSVILDPYLYTSDPSALVWTNFYGISSSGSFFNLGSYVNSGFTSNFGSTVLGVRGYGPVKVHSNLTENVPFSVVYGSDAGSYNTLQAILAALNNQSNSDIIANANQNAQAIQDNQDKNTSQILNGWENDSPAESGDIGNLDELESGLIDDANNQADSHRVNINDSVIGSIQRLTSSFGAVSALFQDITLGSIPDISVLIYFSIFIGLVPLIVGLSVQGLRARDRSDKLKSRKGKKGD